MTNQDHTSGFGQFMAEMRRRHVVRFALGYSAAAFVVLQLAEIVFPAFGIGESGLRILVVVTGLGFLPSLVLAWMYDLTTEGIQRTGQAATANPLLPRLALGALLVATLVVTGALGLYLTQQGVFDSSTEAEPAVDGTNPVQLAAYDPTAPIRSIAVLPLDDFSPGGDQAYFAAGMHEELIAKLSSLEEIRVVSRTTTMGYADTELSSPEIGRELDADVLVEGSVSRTDSRTRVTLQLIHAPSDSHIQTLQWDREDVEDVLAFQTEIAHEVVHAVAVEYDDESVFVQAETEVAPEAQEAYFRGRYEVDRGTPEGYLAAEEYFADALEADPGFAAARAGLAGARFLMDLEQGEMTEAELERAREEALAALRMDSSSMEALDVLSLIERSAPHLLGEGVMIPAPGAEPKRVHVFGLSDGRDSIVIDMQAFDTAWVSAVTSLGERIEARVRQRTVVVEEGEAKRSMLEARRLTSTGRYAEARGALEEVVAASPDHDEAWSMLARAHATTGNSSAVLATVQRWSREGGALAPDADEVRLLREATTAEGVDGYWRWRLDRLEALGALGVSVPFMELASTHAALGHDDEALEYLLDALAAGESGAFMLRSDPAWDGLRADPRLREIVRQAQMMRFSPRRRSGPGGSP